MRNRLFSLLLALSLLPCAALGESLTLDEMNAAEDATPLSAAEATQPVESAARADFIDRILALAETLYTTLNLKTFDYPLTTSNAFDHICRQQTYGFA